MSAELKDRAGSTDSGAGLLRDELRNPTMPTGDKNLRDGTRSYSFPHYGIVDLVPADGNPNLRKQACLLKKLLHAKLEKNKIALGWVDSESPVEKPSPTRPQRTCALMAASAVGRRRPKLGFAAALTAGHGTNQSSTTPTLALFEN